MTGEQEKQVGALGIEKRGKNETGLEFLKKLRFTPSTCLLTPFTLWTTYKALIHDNTAYFDAAAALP